jgi:hypothetical protein
MEPYKDALSCTYWNIQAAQCRGFYVSKLDQPFNPWCGDTNQHSVAALACSKTNP